MKTYGICAPPTTCDRGVPVPTTARDRDEDHITARLERTRAFVSPIVLANPAPFTADQLQAAGFAVQGAKKPKKAKAVKTPRAPKAPKVRAPRAAAYDKAAVVAAYAAGETSESVAARFGIVSSTVLTAVRAAGVPVRTSASRPVKFDHAAAVAEYLAGEPTKTIATRHGVSACSILNAVKAAGHTPHPTGATRGTGTPRKVDDTEVARLYTDEHLSPPKIAARLGVGPIAIRRSLDRQGIARRDDRAGNSGGNNRHPASVLRAAGNLYAEGLTRNQVAERLGIHIRVVDKGIDLVGATRRPAAHIPGHLPGVDRAAALLKDLMRTNGVTSADVRAWAKETGRDCSDVGIPARHLVEDYLLERTPAGRTA